MPGLKHRMPLKVSRKLVIESIDALKASPSTEKVLLWLGQRVILLLRIAKKRHGISDPASSMEHLYVVIVLFFKFFYLMLLSIFRTQWLKLLAQKE